MSGRSNVVLAAAVLIAATIAIAVGATAPARSAETRASAQSATGCTSSKGKLRYGIAGAGISQLDPNTINFAGQAPLQTLLYNGLTKYDRNMNVVPDLATKWRSSADLKTWWFTLRNGREVLERPRLHPGRRPRQHPARPRPEGPFPAAGERKGHPLGA